MLKRGSYGDRLDGHFTPDAITAPMDLFQVKDAHKLYESVPITATQPGIVDTSPMAKTLIFVGYTVGMVVVVSKNTLLSKINSNCGDINSTKVHSICLDGNSTKTVTAPKDLLKEESELLYKSVPSTAAAPQVVATSPLASLISRVIYTHGQMVVVTRPMKIIIIQFIKST